MPDYQVVDAHAHVLRSRDIAQRAHAIAPVRTAYIGTVEDLPPAMEAAGISKVVAVGPLALEDMRQAALSKLPADINATQRADAERKVQQTLASRLARHNEWLSTLHHQDARIYPFICIDPVLDAQTMRHEIATRAGQGAWGVKLHPQTQKMRPDDRRLWPAYETCQAMDFPILSDSGLWPGASFQWSEPRYWDEVLDAFPRLRLVLAHLGKALWDQTRKLAKAHPVIGFDIAEIIDPYRHQDHKEYYISDADLAALIREVGVERVVYGSDFPWFEPALGIQRVKGLPLTDLEKRAILSENAIRIYKLS